MAGSVNKVIIVGNLGRDPEVRTFQNGGRVCNLSVATAESWRDKATGERKEKTEWHRVAIFNDRLVDVASKYLSKGSKVYLEGQLETRKWTDQSGAEKYSTEIVLKQFRGELTMLDTRRSDDFQDSEEEPAADYGAAAGKTEARKSGGGAPIMDEDIPFGPQVD